MKYTRTWKVYGRGGHRQRESFAPSFELQLDENTTIICSNSDRTGTNDYSLFTVIANSREECKYTLFGQLSDGTFENSRVGRVVEVTE